MLQSTLLLFREMQSPKPQDKHDQQAKEAHIESAVAVISKQAERAQHVDGSGTGLIRAHHPDKYQVCPCSAFCLRLCSCVAGKTSDIFEISACVSDMF